MKIKKHILIPLMVLLLFGSMDAMAAIEQAIQVKGKVVDNIGEPVIGANVVVKGTTTGVITSIDGSFAIDAVKGFYYCGIFYRLFISGSKSNW